MHPFSRCRMDFAPFGAFLLFVLGAVFKRSHQSSEIIIKYIWEVFGLTDLYAGWHCVGGWWAGTRAWLLFDGLSHYHEHICRFCVNSLKLFLQRLTSVRGGEHGIASRAVVKLAACSVLNVCAVGTKRECELISNIPLFQAENF